MARPQSNTVEYFPHYISDGKKMFFIETKYGNDGFATWFKILESLASTENHYLDLENETDVMFLSSKCRVEEKVLFSILNDLSKLGEIDKDLWSEKIVFSEKFIESIQDAYKRRNSKCMQKDGLCIHLLSLCRLKPKFVSNETNINTQSKVKEIKEEESKQNESKENNDETEIKNPEIPIDDFPPLPKQPNKELIDETIDHINKLFRKEYTRTMFTGNLERRIIDLTKKFTKEQIFQAHINITKNDWHKKQQYAMCSPNYLLEEKTIMDHLFTHKQALLETESKQEIDYPNEVYDIFYNDQNLTIEQANEIYLNSKK